MLPDWTTCLPGLCRDNAARTAIAFRKPRRHTAGMMPHALDTVAFGFFASACAAAVRGTPAPPLPPGVDPPALVALGTRHRIAAPVLDRLAQATCGTAAAATLEASARRQRLAALHRTQRLVQLSQALTGAGIRHLAVKGPALAMQLYGDVAARDSKDLDLLIDPARFDAAVPVIAALGYVPVDDGAPDTAVGEHAAKHRTFRHGDIEIEAHTRLLDMADFVALPFEAVWAARVAVPLGGAAVQAMSPVDTLLYLCAHGTEHCWFRLKWLQDIARISMTYDPDTLGQAMRIARRGGYDRILDAALLLVDDLFGIAPLVARPRADRATRRLVDLSRDALAAPAELASEPTLGWLLRRSAVQLACRRTWHDRAAFVRHLLTSPRSFDTDPHPARAWRTYLARPFRLLGAHYARRRSRR